MSMKKQPKVVMQKSADLDYVSVCPVIEFALVCDFRQKGSKVTRASRHARRLDSMAWAWLDQLDQ